MTDAAPPRRQDALPRAAFLLACLFFSLLYGFCSARYGWFPARWLNAAFVQFEQRDAERPDLSVHHVHPARHDFEGVRTYDGYAQRGDAVLLTGFWPGREDKPAARLIDREGVMLHEWQVDPALIWPTSPHKDSGAGAFNTSSNYLHGSYLFDDGDLLFNIEFMGLCRIDAAGKVVWRVDHRTHHSVTRDEEGNFWVCMVRWIETEQQRAGRFEGLDLPLAEDCALKVSPDGEVLQVVSMLEVVYDSPMRELLWRVGRYQYGDVLHMNDVEPLSSRLAAQYPAFAAGDLLVSLRHIDAVFVVDPKTREVKWSAHEPWMRQHDPDFLGDGWISVFDNRNDPKPDGAVLGGSRFWLIRPATGETKLVYPNRAAASDHERRFYTELGGKAQHFDDGHWLLTEAQYGRVFEIDEDGNTVWEWAASRRSDGVSVSEVLEGTSYPITAEMVASWRDG